MNMKVTPMQKVPIAISSTLSRRPISMLARPAIAKHANTPFIRRLEPPHAVSSIPEIIAPAPKLDRINPAALSSATLSARGVERAYPMPGIRNRVKVIKTIRYTKGGRSAM